MIHGCLIPHFIAKYNLGYTISKGSFSLIKQGHDCETGTKYAVKIIPKSNMSTTADMERFERRARAIFRMNHPGIVKIYDFIVDASYYYLIMELCKGNTFIEQCHPGVINETTSRPIFKQVLETVKYMHDQGIAHRKLKLENVRIDDAGRIKITDFGFSPLPNPMEMVCAAPEVILGQTYDGCTADMWSCGVLLFCLVTGELPWKEGRLVSEQITKGNFETPEGLSPFCRDLIERLLSPDPSARLTAGDAIMHPWLKGIELSWDDAPGIQSG